MANMSCVRLRHKRGDLNAHMPPHVLPLLPPAPPLRQKQDMTMDVLRYAGAPDKEKKRVQYYFDYITQYNHPTQVQCGLLLIQEAATCGNPWRCPRSTHTCHAFPSHP